MLLSILDENITSIGYYTTLLERLGISISISKICKSVIKDWSPELFSTDFDYFCKNINYLTGTVELGNIKKFTVSENCKDIYQYREAVKDVIKEPELSEIIVDIANNCTTPSDDYFIESIFYLIFLIIPFLECTKRVGTHEMFAFDGALFVFEFKLVVDE